MIKFQIPHQIVLQRNWLDSWDRYRESEIGTHNSTKYINCWPKPKPKLLIPYRACFHKFVSGTKPKTIGQNYGSWDQLEDITSEGEKRALKTECDNSSQRDEDFQYEDLQFSTQIL